MPPKKKVMATLQDCAGCYDCVYHYPPWNGCWSFDTAEMKTRFRISVNSPMNVRSNYTEMQKPKCYKQKGYVFLDNIPRNAV